MDNETYEILQSAVNIARDEQIQKLFKLKARLLEIYPGKIQKINDAINFWASRTRKPT